LSRDEAQVQIARSLAEKDMLRGQLMELQEKVFTMKACSRERERREKSRVKLSIFYHEFNTQHSLPQWLCKFRVIFNIVQLICNLIEPHRPLFLKGHFTHLH